MDIIKVESEVNVQNEEDFSEMKTDVYIPPTISLEGAEPEVILAYSDFCACFFVACMCAHSRMLLHLCPQYQSFMPVI
jgi:hypothetical protein